MSSSDAENNQQLQVAQERNSLSLETEQQMQVNQYKKLINLFKFCVMNCSITNPLYCNEITFIQCYMHVVSKSCHLNL